jgi:hypothetical protein
MASGVMETKPDAVQTTQHERSLGRVTLASGDAAGVMQLASMSEEEFNARLAILKKGQERLRIIQAELLIGPTKDNSEGEDYGVIPGTKKPTLLKPGSEKLCLFYGLVPTFEERWIEGDGQTTPHLRVKVTCYLHRGSKDGPIVGEGAGAANSWEKKHRWRRAQRSCPACGVAGAIRKSKYPDKNTGDYGWYCREEGCKANFVSDDPAIIDQEMGDVENPDPFEVENTLIKMGYKRAQVDATLRTTATSGIFSQDLEDNPEDHGGKKAAPAPPPAQNGHAQQNGSAKKPASAPPPPQAAKPARQGLPACPRCKKSVPVMRSKFGPEFYCNPKATREQGCGFKFGEADLQDADLFKGANEPHEDAEPGSEG